MKDFEEKFFSWLDENGPDLALILTGTFVLSCLWYICFILKPF